MRRLTNHGLGAVLGLLALASVGCGNATAPALDPGAAAGTYALEHATWRGPATGTLVLTREGRATYRVQYPALDGPTEEFSATGSFRLARPDSILLALRHDGATEPSAVWRVSGVWNRKRITLRYPHPGDGEIVEIYRPVRGGRIGSLRLTGS